MRWGFLGSPRASKFFMCEISRHGARLSLAACVKKLSDAPARELTAGLRRLARLPASPLAAREIIQKHVHLAALLDGLNRVPP